MESICVLFTKELPCKVISTHILFLLYRKVRPIKQNAPRGCARICLEDVLRTKFGVVKRASTLGKCNVAERACTLCSFIGKFVL